jgi:hypothetical protein
MIDAERCKRVVNAIRDLSKTEVDELFKLLYKDNCEYTQNNNGIFFNLSWVSEETMTKIEQFIEFCNQSNTELTKYETLCDVLNHKLYENTAHNTKETAREKQASQQAKASLARMRYKMTPNTDKAADTYTTAHTATIKKTPIITTTTTVTDIDNIDNIDNIDRDIEADHGIDIDVDPEQHLDPEADEELQKGGSINGKMSSSMRFYLLKKRFSKPLVLTTTYENDLMTETYMM